MKYIINIFSFPFLYMFELNQALQLDKIIRIQGS